MLALWLQLHSDISQSVSVRCRYSSLSDADKAAAFTLWQKKWTHFIEQTLEMSSDHCYTDQRGFSECDTSP